MTNTYTPEQAHKIARQWEIKREAQLTLARDMSAPQWMRDDATRRAADCQRRADNCYILAGNHPR